MRTLQREAGHEVGLTTHVGSGMQFPAPAVGAETGSTARREVARIGSPRASIGRNSLPGPRNGRRPRTRTFYVDVHFDRRSPMIMVRDALVGFQTMLVLIPRLTE